MAKGNISVDSENLFPIIKNGFIPIRIFSLENLFQTVVTRSQIKETCKYR